jgi:hypothetical protein
MASANRVKVMERRGLFRIIKANVGYEIQKKIKHPHTREQWYYLRRTLYLSDAQWLLNASPFVPRVTGGPQ